ncbi:MerR family DNA-binding protein [Gilvimarinus sp. F26214L]|uniref:MerR family DNA-binding protein n=1 Tax=Gilvimarinus sp. DZF01 TaxID=3461371 RepID=UPI004045D541
MHVHQLAKSLKTTPDTVRYYTRIGLLRPIKDSNNAYKCYGDEERKRLRFILCARQMGFSVDEIGQILTEAEKSDTPCPQVAELLQQRLEDIQQRLAQTLSLQDVLSDALKQWQSCSNPAPTGEMLNELIENFVD